MNTLFRLPPCGGTVPGRLLLALALSVVSPLSADPGPSVVSLPGLPGGEPAVGAHDHNVSALAWDGEVLWAGTFDAGLARWHQGRWTEVPIAGAPKHRWINTLAWDGEHLWVGSAGGLARVSAGGHSIVELEELDGPVNSIRKDSGLLVVAGNDRVWIRRGEDWETIELPGETLHAALVRNGTLWTGGMWGALERHGDVWRRYSELNGRLPHSWVTALLPVGDTVWAGTYDAGLIVLAGDAPARIVRRDAWVNFNALTRTRDGVAVGTMEDGLLLWNAATRSWRRLTMADGLPSDDVTAVVEVGETLWVGTRGGVAHTTPPGGPVFPQSPP